MYYLITDIYIFGVFLSHLCSGQKTFTVEEAVETIGFGRFHIALFLIMGSTGVSVCNQHHQPDETLPSFSLLLCNNNYKSPQKHIAAHFFPHIPSQAGFLLVSTLTKISIGQLWYWACFKAKANRLTQGILACPLPWSSIPQPQRFRVTWTK